MTTNTEIFLEIETYSQRYIQTTNHKPEANLSKDTFKEIKYKKI